MKMLEEQDEGWQARQEGHRSQRTASGSLVELDETAWSMASKPASTRVGLR